MLVDSWRRYRAAAFGGIGAALVLVGALIPQARIEQADARLMAVFVTLGVLMVLLVTFDTAIHAWQGRGQACRNCGHVRPLRSFRLAGPCPECGME